VAGFNRNGWPTSVGIGGRITSESLAALRRITQVWQKAASPELAPEIASWQQAVVPRLARFQRYPARKVGFLKLGREFSGKEKAADFVGGLIAQRGGY
jgi:hypothetical protein